MEKAEKILHVFSWKQIPNWLVLSLFLLGGGLLSMVLRYEMSWDFANYHYFGPWAFLNDRVGYDVAAAGFNAFYNPFMDMPLYFLIKYFNDYPLFIHFMQGLWSGAMLYLIFKISLLCFDTNTWRGKISVVLAMLVALTGNAFFMQIGTSSNDIQTTVLVMISFYMLLKEINRDNMRAWVFLAAGYIMGASMGLKLTTVTYCVSSGLALILFYKHLSKPLLFISLFAVGGLCGFLTFEGYWMFILWEKFGNPFFPFANAIFKSPWAEADDNSYMFFRPRTFTQFLIHPFVMSLSFNRFEGMAWSVDFRMAIIYSVAIIYAIRLFVRRVRKQPIEIDKQQKFLMLFLLLSYLIWVNLFSLMRFYVPIEMLSAIYIVKALMSIKPKSLISESLYYTFMSILLFIMVSTPYFTDYWGKKIYDEKWMKYVQFDDVKIPDDTLLLSYNLPMAMALPYFTDVKGVKNLRMVSVLQEVYLLASIKKGKSFDYFNMNPHWIELKKEVMDNHKGPIFALINETKDPKFQATKDSPLIRGLKCRLLYNNIVPVWMLCVPPEMEEQVWGDIEE